LQETRYLLVRMCLPENMIIRTGSLE